MPLDTYVYENRATHPNMCVVVDRAPPRVLQRHQLRICRKELEVACAREALMGGWLELDYVCGGGGGSCDERTARWLFCLVGRCPDLVVAGKARDALVATLERTKGCAPPLARVVLMWHAVVDGVPYWVRTALVNEKRNADGGNASRRGANSGRAGTC